MRRILTAVLGATMIVGVLAGPAAADQNPAVNANACAAAGGAFSGPSTGVPGHTCVIEAAGTVSYVTASHPNKAWTAQLTTPGSIETYTFTPNLQGNPHGYSSVGGGVATLTGCTNHQGKAIADYAVNPNCQPA